MNLLQKTLSIGLATAAAFTATGAAATLALGSQSLAAGNAAVTSCGVSSLVATRAVDNAGKVLRVDVAGIPAECAGHTLSVTLVGPANAALASGTATVGSCATTCSAAVTSLTAPAAAASVAGYSFGLVGP